jgi:hypothetical protein
VRATGTIEAQNELNRLFGRGLSVNQVCSATCGHPAVATELGMGSRSRRLGKLACERVRSGERGRASLTSLSTLPFKCLVHLYVFPFVPPRNPRAYTHPFLFSSP